MYRMELFITFRSRIIVYLDTFLYFSILDKFTKLLNIKIL